MTDPLVFNSFSTGGSVGIKEKNQEKILRMLNCHGSLSVGAVMKALWQGRFYVSTGADILSIVRVGDTVTVKTSGAHAIHMRTGGRRCQSRFAESEPLTEASFTLRPTDKFFRIKVIGTDGKMAYSQAYPI